MYVFTVRIFYLHATASLASVFGLIRNAAFDAIFLKHISLVKRYIKWTLLLLLCRQLCVMRNDHSHIIYFVEAFNRLSPELSISIATPVSFQAILYQVSSCCHTTDKQKHFNYRNL